MTPWTLSSTTWVPRRAVLEVDRAVLSRIVQIVTSAVRIDVALALSRTRPLFVPPTLCGALTVLVHKACVLRAIPPGAAATVTPAWTEPWARLLPLAQS